ncbi:hypothetical protein Gotur_019002 [Gossypium turneri]
MAFAMEALACSHVIRLAADLGQHKVTFEGDSLSVIRKAYSSLHNVLAIEAYIWVVKAIVSSFYHCLFAHIPLEGNTLAHLLATMRLMGLWQGDGMGFTVSVGFRGICRSRHRGGCL